MPPLPICLGVVVFGLCTLVHVLIWRHEVPKRGAALLVALYIAVPPIPMGGAAALGLLSGMDAVQTYLLHVSLSLLYVSMYPAVRAGSPSLDILLLVGAAADTGVAEVEIFRRCRGTLALDDKIDALQIYGLVEETDHSFYLSSRGRLVIRVFLTYRRLLGLPPGQG